MLPFSVPGVADFLVGMWVGLHGVGIPSCAGCRSVGCMGHHGSRRGPLGGSWGDMEHWETGLRLTAGMISMALV